MGEVVPLRPLTDSADPLDALMDSLQRKPEVVLTGQAGCLTGDSEILVNRGGKGFRLPLKDVVRGFNGEVSGGKTWDPNIPTYVQCRNEDGHGRRGLLSRAIRSGVKRVYLLTTETGRTLRATATHLLYAERGWVVLGDLKPGQDRVCVLQRPEKTGASEKPRYRVIELARHPYAAKSVYTTRRYGGSGRKRKTTQRRVPYHRVVAEATLSKLPVEEFIRRVRADEHEGLVFLDPRKSHVHHKDHKPGNNTPENLEALSIKEHHLHHTAPEHVLWKESYELVVSVEAGGDEETFDLCMAEIPHNFTANGFVVHNSGKTTMMRGVLDRWKGPVTLLGPTGKAARRLTEITGHPAGTMHSAVYPPPHEDPKTGQLTFATDDERIVGSLGGLVAVDEASMVDEQLREDLQGALAQDCKLMWVGDPYQLRPINGKLGPALDTPDVHLTKIWRQAEGSPIIDLGSALRKLTDPRMLRRVLLAHRRQNTAGQVVVLSLGAAGQPKPGEWLAHARRTQESGGVPPDWDATLLCHTNAARHKLNHHVRHLLGRPPNDVVPGDRLVVLQNVHELQMLNGQIVPVDGVTHGGQFGTEDVPPYLYEIGSTEARPFFVKPDLFDKKVRDWKKARRDESRQWEMLCRRANEDKHTFAEERWRLESETYKQWDAAGNAHRRQWGPANRLVHCDFGDALTVHKCVAPDTLVETNAGLLPIRSIPSHDGIIATPDGSANYRNLVANLPSWALRIETEGGYALTVTRDHGLDTWYVGSGDYARREARDLVEGDWLRMRPTVTVEPDRPVVLPGAPWVDSRAKTTYPLPHKVTQRLAEWLGMFVADGTLYKNGFRLVKRHADVVEHFAALTRVLFGVEFSVQPHKSSPAFVAEINSTYLASWLRSLGGLAPWGKAVPECILRSPSARHADFIRGLTIDGSVHVKDGMLDHIELMQSSPGLVPMLRTMLLRLGIVTGRVRGRKEYDNIAIYGSTAAEFVERIGLCANHHNAAARAAQPRSTTQRYRVPVTPTEAMRFYKEGHITRSDQGNARNAGYMSRDKANLVPELEARLRWHHERIVSIEEIVVPSMCVEVPAGHQFLQNGISGWNSQGSQWDTVGIVFAQSSWWYVSKKFEDAKRWWYTAATRASTALVIWL